MSRNLHDTLEHIPTLSVDFDDHEPINPMRLAKEKQRSTGNGFLWALVLLQSAALGAGGWWGWQQIEQNKQQLLDAQHNFARINEQLGAKIQSIDGKLISTETSVNNGSKNLLQQITGLTAQVDAQQSELKKQQDSYKQQNARQETLEKQLNQFASTSKAQVESLATLGQQLNAQSKQLSAQNEALSLQKSTREQTLSALQLVQQSHNELQKQLKQVAEEAATIRAVREQLKQVSEETAAIRGIREQLGSVSSLATNLSSLQKQVAQAQSVISKLEREQLALKREQLALKAGQESRTAAATKGNSPAEFDAFRAQTTRSINNLQNQLQRLQQAAAGNP